MTQRLLSIGRTRHTHLSSMLHIGLLVVAACSNEISQIEQLGISTNAVDEEVYTITNVRVSFHGLAKAPDNRIRAGYSPAAYVNDTGRANDWIYREASELSLILSVGGVETTVATEFFDGLIAFDKDLEIETSEKKFTLMLEDVFDQYTQSDFNEWVRDWRIVVTHEDQADLFKEFQEFIKDGGGSDNESDGGSGDRLVASEEYRIRRPGKTLRQLSKNICRGEPTQSLEKDGASWGHICTFKKRRVEGRCLANREQP